MAFQDTEIIVQQMIEDFSHESDERRKDKNLLEWRAKLASEPHFFQPFQIDMIVREVRESSTNDSLQPGWFEWNNAAMSLMSRPRQ